MQNYFTEYLVSCKHIIYFISTTWGFLLAEEFKCLILKEGIRYYPLIQCIKLIQKTRILFDKIRIVLWTSRLSSSIDRYQARKYKNTEVMIFKISIIVIVKGCSILQSILLNPYIDIKIPTQCVQPYIYLFNSLTSLIPRSRVLLGKLTSFQLVKKFPAFYGTRRFITAFTSARHLSLSWASLIQFIPPHPTSWRSILILSSIYAWVFQVISFPQISPPKPCIRLSSPLPHTCYIPHLSHSSRFYHWKNIGWAVQIIKFHFMWFKQFIPCRNFMHTYMCFTVRNIYMLLGWVAQSV